MTHKQNMLAVLRGQPVPGIPWVPRFDLWYRAHRRAGTLPRKYADASRVEMLDDLGFAYHAVIPDFKALRTPDDEAHRALGIYNLSCMPVQTVFEDIRYRMIQDGDRQIVEYDTPAGPLSTVMVYDEAMRAAGGAAHVRSNCGRSVRGLSTVFRAFESGCPVTRSRQAQDAVGAGRIAPVRHPR